MESKKLRSVCSLDLGASLFRLPGPSRARGLRPCSRRSAVCLQKASDGRHMLGSHRFVLIYFQPVTMILAQRAVSLTCLLRALGFSTWRRVFFFSLQNPHLEIAFWRRKQHAGSPLRSLLKKEPSDHIHLICRFVPICCYQGAVNGPLFKK